ncbi:hypothetical protein [Lysobacter sp. D1-1-M9]|uniref:hypothetical protein n=1 Tax=Novilysobacter longmucuonensis TaxID=3098603 RepID=UPI002FC871C3
MLSIHRAFAALALVALSAACHRNATPAADPASAEPTGPVEAVTRLADDLRRNDLTAYARHALPPELHARIEAAWSEGRTLWPLTELPLDRQLPGFIGSLAAPESEPALLATYQRQFAGAHRELRSAAATLGLFAAQYVRSEGDYSEVEREHYVQLIGALSQWGRQAPLGDPQRARTAIPQLAAAARLTGLTDPDAYARFGMDRSLQRLGPFFGRFKQTLVDYGLDLDAALGSIDASLLEQTGDTARVRLRYTLGTQPIDAIVRLERRDGRWYLSDALRHAEAEAGPAPEMTVSAAAAPAAPVAPDPQRGAPTG